MPGKRGCAPSFRSPEISRVSRRSLACHWIELRAMRIAFYAPLKSPTHGTPSGDRRVAGLLMDALAHAGHRVQVASTFRTYDGDGDEPRQRALRAQGEALAEQLAADWQAAPADERPQLWFTYHLYYKAPDWLGPAGGGAPRLSFVISAPPSSARPRPRPGAFCHPA